MLRLLHAILALLALPESELKRPFLASVSLLLLGLACCLMLFFRVLPVGFLGAFACKRCLQSACDPIPL